MPSPYENGTVNNSKSSKIALAKARTMELLSGLEPPTSSLPRMCQISMGSGLSAKAQYIVVESG